MKKNGKKQPAQKKKSGSFLAVCKGLAKWSLAFLYSAWVFVLGILVGRETSPVKFDIENLQKELVELKAAVIKEEQKRFEADQETLHKKVPDLIDNLKSAENDADMPPAVATPGITLSEEPDAKKMSESSDGKESALQAKKEDAPEKTEVPEKTALKTKKKDIASAVEAPQQAEKKETAAVSQTPEADDSDKETDAPKNVTLQVASFRKLTDADRMVAELKAKGYPAYVAMGEVSAKGTFFRVRVGHFENKAAGRSMKNKLKKDKLNSYFTNIRR